MQGTATATNPLVRDIRRTVRLCPYQDEALEATAKAKNTTVSDVMRMAIQAYARRALRAAEAA